VIKAPCCLFVSSNRNYSDLQKASSKTELKESKPMRATVIKAALLAAAAEAIDTTIDYLEDGVD
jgi:hypothetical protein